MLGLLLDSGGRYLTISHASPYHLNSYPVDLHPDILIDKPWRAHQRWRCRYITPCERPYPRHGPLQNVRLTPMPYAFHIAANTCLMFMIYTTHVHGLHCLCLFGISQPLITIYISPSLYCVPMISSHYYCNTHNVPPTFSTYDYHTLYDSYILLAIVVHTPYIATTSPYNPYLYALGMVTTLHIYYYILTTRHALPGIYLT